MRIGDLGWASTLTFEAVIRRRLGSRLHVATPTELDALDAVLRVAVDL